MPPRKGPEFSIGPVFHLTNAKLIKNPDQNANQIQIEMRTIFFSSGVGAREGRKHPDNSSGNKISDVSLSSRYHHHHQHFLSDEGLFTSLC